MRLFSFLFLFISALLMSAQSERPLRIRLVDSTTHRVLATIRPLNLVKVELNNGTVYKGLIKIRSDSVLVIKGQGIRPEMIKHIYNKLPVIIAASTIIFYPPSFVVTPVLVTWVLFDTPDKNDSYYVLISDKSKRNLELDEIEEHKTKDSLMAVSNPDSNYKSSLRIDSNRIVRLNKCLGTPGDFMFIGTDLEKLPVPNFSLNAEYFFKPGLGVFAQMGYKPMNPDGSVFYMTNRTNPYYFCEHYMFRFSPVVTFGNDPKRRSFFFIGPSLYYKTMNADHVDFCLYNNGDGDDRYVTYWYDETIKGFGLRAGTIPKNLLGIGLSVEVSYRFSKSHSFYPEYMWNYFTQSYYVVNNHNYATEEAPMLDASVTWRLRIRKHK